MGAAVELRDHLMPLDSERGLELVTNLARYAEGLLDEAAVKKIYRFSDEDWDRLGSNDELVEKNLSRENPTNTQRQQRAGAGPDLVCRGACRPWHHFTRE